MTGTEKWTDMQQQAACLSHFSWTLGLDSGDFVKKNKKKKPRTYSSIKLKLTMMEYTSATMLRGHTGQKQERMTRMR